ncbi:MAG TPA: GNAT family N-acetyltransferase [Flavilitoribacter sp.]|nr:GNAT family N-acetyltransferase [Lewinella sp.]MCB9279725.1 GNAT family N-acetyltransferase [Lewinellaceae bacterium]HMQ63075.1 GNAT family N-acetyltransferase [Flavilitoribacter sp.]HMQ91206.1 GNAT family N-acetyltransferase [Flavilitoribacter sp.]
MILLETIRLVLAELTWDDLGNIHDLYSCPEVEEFNTIGIPEDLNMTKILIRSTVEAARSGDQKNFGWTINLKSSGMFIGEAGLSVTNDRFRMGEIYYNLLPEFWGQGFATEAVKTIIKFGFEELRLHRIEAGVTTDNQMSIKVLEKVGMTREGLKRKMLPIRGNWKDNYHYAILEEDERDY